MSRVAFEAEDFLLTSKIANRRHIEIGLQRLGLASSGRIGCDFGKRPVHRLAG